MFVGLTAIDVSLCGALPSQSVLGPAFEQIGLGGLTSAAEAIPLSKATVKRVLDALLDLGVVARVERGLYCRVTVQ